MARRLSTAAARPGYEIVEAAARTVILAGLRDGDSAFTPGTPIWVPRVAEELYAAFVQQPLVGASSFVEKLRIQLADVSPAALQLTAELLYLNVLPLNNVRGVTKRSRINEVLRWHPDHPEIPAELDRALDHGVLNGGVGFNVQVWAQLSFLVQFVRAWTSLTDDERTEALGDPLRFRRHVREVPPPAVPSQRGVLLYLAFPHFFEAIAQAHHKTKIRKAYLDLVEVPTDDVDLDLREIRARLQEDSPEQPVHFYFEPWRDRWMPPSPGRGRHVWLVRSESTGLASDWVDQAFVSVDLGIREYLAGGVPAGDVQRAVDDANPHVDYVRRREFAAAGHAFLSRMQPGDLVATMVGGRLHLGIVEDGPVIADRDISGRFRRPVRWRPLDLGIDIDLLPAGLQASLAVGGRVVDLSQHLGLMESLVAWTTDDASLANEFEAADEVIPEGPPTLPMPDESFAETLHVRLEFIQDIVELLQARRQVVLYGPPGTGKTYVAERLARYLADPAGGTPDRVMIVQFHPSTTYEDFFEGFRPAGTPDGSQMRFELAAGPLSTLAGRARDDLGRPYFLVIDEINRANLARVFGELYYLLEYRNRTIRLLYRPTEPFLLPDNLFIIGTMNTVDRSVVNVDAAIRRRFAFVELHPDAEPIAGLLETWLKATGRDPERAGLLNALNERIEGHDFKIGPAYLMKEDADTPKGLERVWRYSILPLLAEYYHGRLTPTEVEDRFGLESLRSALAEPPAGGSPE